MLRNVARARGSPRAAPRLRPSKLQHDRPERGAARSRVARAGTRSTPSSVASDSSVAPTPRGAASYGAPVRRAGRRSPDRRSWAARHGHDRPPAPIRTASGGRTPDRRYSMRRRSPSRNNSAIESLGCTGELMASNQPRRRPSQTRRARSKASGCPSPDRTRAGQRDTSSASAILTVRAGELGRGPGRGQPDPAAPGDPSILPRLHPRAGPGPRRRETAVASAGACSSVLSSRRARSRIETSVLLAIKTPWPSTAARIAIPIPSNVFPDLRASHQTNDLFLLTVDRGAGTRAATVRGRDARPAPGPSVGRKVFRRPRGKRRAARAYSYAVYRHHMLVLPLCYVCSRQVSHCSVAARFDVRRGSKLSWRSTQRTCVSRRHWGTAVRCYN